MYIRLLKDQVFNGEQCPCCPYRGIILHANTVHLVDSVEESGVWLDLDEGMICFVENDEFVEVKTCPMCKGESHLGGNLVRNVPNVRWNGHERRSR